MVELDIRLHTSQATLFQRAPEILSRPSLGLDIETTGLDPYTSSIISIQIANGLDNIVDVIDVRRDNFDHFFKIFLPQFKGRMYIHNAKFDLKFTRHNYGLLYFDDLFDTKLVYGLLNLGRDYKTNLEHVAKKYLGMALDKGIRNEFLLPMFQIMDLSEEQLHYAALDAWVLPRIGSLLEKEVQQDGAEKIAWLENKVVPAFVKAELAGFELDTDAWSKIYEEERTKEIELGKRLRELADWPTFNPRSDDQVKVVMRKLNLEVPVVYGKETTKAEFLGKIDHPFIHTLMEYRTAEKRASTYGDEFLNNLNPVTGFLHTDFDQLGTKTGRISSKNPNFQNLPKKEDGIKYRKCFIAGDGNVLVTADFTGQEIMVMAEDSRDPALIAIYEEGLDRHQKTAADLFNVSYSRVTKQQRKVAKIFNFGVSYGSSAWNMANKLNLPLEEVEARLKDYWRAYPTLQKWQRRKGLEAYRDGYSETFWGRRRYYPERNRENMNAIMRQGANHVIQGTSADETKLATVYIDQELEDNKYRATFVNFIHDETVLRTTKELGPAVEELGKRNMERAGAEFVKVIPQKAEVSVGDYWM